MLKQSTYAKKVMFQFGMGKCNSTKHPMEHKQHWHKDSEGELVDAMECRRVIGCLRYRLYTKPISPMLLDWQADTWRSPP